MPTILKQRRYSTPIFILAFIIVNFSLISQHSESLAATGDMEILREHLRENYRRRTERYIRLEGRDALRGDVDSLSLHNFMHISRRELALQPVPLSLFSGHLS